MREPAYFGQIDATQIYEPFLVLPQVGGPRGCSLQMYFRNESGIVSWCCFSGIYIAVYRFPMIYHILHGLIHEHVEFQRSGHEVLNPATLHDTGIILGDDKARKVFIGRNNDAWIIYFGG